MGDRLERMLMLKIWYLTLVLSITSCLCQQADDDVPDESYIEEEEAINSPDAGIYLYPNRLRVKRSESNQGQGFQPWLGRKKKNNNDDDIDAEDINYLWSVLGRDVRKKSNAVENDPEVERRGMNSKFGRFGRTVSQSMSRFGRNNNYQWSRMRKSGNQAANSGTKIRKNQYQWGHL